MPTEQTMPEDDLRELVTPADNAEPEARQVEAPAQREAAKDGTPEQPKRPAGFEHKRNAIVEKIKAQRKAEDDAPAFDMPDEMERMSVGKAANTRADRLHKPEDDLTAKDVTADDIQPPARRVLKVNGREIEVTEEQMVEYAQKAMAADSILEDAKTQRIAATQRLAEVEKLLENQRRLEGPQPAPTSKTAEDTKPATDAELDDIIDQIQTGDIKAGAEALRKYGDQILARAKAEQAATEQAIDVRVNQAIAHKQYAQEAESALDSFIAENGDFAESQRRVNVLTDVTFEVMNENLMKIGVKPETLADFAQAHGLASQAAIVTAYRQLSLEGYNLPKAGTILKEAAGRVRKEFGMPNPAAGKTSPKPDNSNLLAERVERKQAMDPQPRRANVAPQPEQTQVSQEAARLRAVQQMRAQRRGR